VIPRGWRRALARSDHPIADVLRAVYEAPSKLSAPIPRALSLPVVWSYLAGRSAVHMARRTLFAEPFFKAHVTSHGRRLHTGIYLHWIQGKGDIIVGDDVTFDGKSSITFASRFDDRPRLVVGDRTGIGHNCEITIAKQVVIGSHCLVASSVIITDSNGHPAHPESRKAGAPPNDHDVRPVTIGDNVWIGKRAIVLPGVTIGEGSIVAAGAVVTNDIAPYTFAAGNPARNFAAVPRSGT
jgi:serine acetyltransferase